MSKQTLQEQCLKELMLLTEANRTALITQSRSAGAYKNASRGKNRFERKKYSKIANAVKNLTQDYCVYAVNLPGNGAGRIPGGKAPVRSIRRQPAEDG